MSDFGEVRPLDSIAENILQKRYYHVGETNWNQVVDRVVDWVVPQQTSWKETAREMMRNRYFIPNSPCLVNAGKKDGGLSACFVVGFEDSILGIYKTKLDFALIAKKGGGCGTTLSNIRPENDFVSGSTHGYAGGPVKFFETICYDMKAMTQAGFREMAMMGVMYYKHPDIMKFIRAKVEEGRMHTTNISVGVDSEFMELVKSDGSYWTEFNGIKYAEVSAREVFQAIVDGAWSNGEPGIVFLDRMNDSPYKYSGQKIEATNPCQPSYATVLTKDGIRTIGDISIGDEIWSGSEWTKVINKWSTGVKPVYKYTTTAGRFIGTENHRVVSGGVKVEVGDAETIDVSIGERFTAEELDPQDVMDGLVIGDGGVHKASNNLVLLYIGEKDQDYFSSEIAGLITRSRPGVSGETHEIETTITAAELPKTYIRTIPDRFFYGDAKKKAGFLRGLFSANGSINGNRVCLKQSSREMIEQVQEMLSSLGIHSYITTNKGKVVKFSNGEYQCRESYDINITNGRSIFRDSIGFIQKYKQCKIEDGSPLKYKTYSVKSVEYLEDVEVFDLTVDADSHTYWTGCCLVSNCGEQPLPANGVCNLGSLDLSKFVNNGEIDLGKLSTAVRVGVRFLDAVIDASAFPTDDITQWVKENRPVGLGYMGFADLLLEMGIAYGSPESLEVASMVGEFIKSTAENESIYLGRTMGVPKACINLPTPRRNVTVISIAPTGTISLIAGCSNGVEPIFSEFTIRSDKTGTYKIEHKNSHDAYFRCAVSGNGGIEVTWQEHVLMQNEVQKYVDSGVSKTINFPNSATKEEVASAFMMAYDLGAVKGMTVYRNGSRQVEVLSPKMINKEKKCPECGGTLVKEGGCTHCDKCEYSFCEVS